MRDLLSSISFLLIVWYHGRMKAPGIKSTVCVSDLLTRAALKCVERNLVCHIVQVMHTGDSKRSDEKTFHGKFVHKTLIFADYGSVFVIFIADIVIVRIPVPKIITGNFVSLLGVFVLGLPQWTCDCEGYFHWWWSFFLVNPALDDHVACRVGSVFLFSSIMYCFLLGGPNHTKVQLVIIRL